MLLTCLYDATNCHKNQLDAGYILMIKLISSLKAEVKTSIQKEGRRKIKKVKIQKSIDKVKTIC